MGIRLLTARGRKGRREGERDGDGEREERSKRGMGRREWGRKGKRERDGMGIKQADTTCRAQAAFGLRF